MEAWCFIIFAVDPPVASCRTASVVIGVSDGAMAMVKIAAGAKLFGVRPVKL